ncbi:MAG: hypothetical protein WCT77_02965 [Bacteroidota bacterium]
MKFLSDVDMLTNGQFGVEWEWAEGGRVWEGFDTAEERDAAIKENQKYNDAHQDEVDAHFKAEDEWLAKMKKEYGE